MQEVEAGWSVHQCAVASACLRACVRGLIDNIKRLWNDYRMILTDNSEVVGDKPVPVPLCPLQFPHRLNLDQTRASEVRGRRLTA